MAEDRDRAAMNGHVAGGDAASCGESAASPASPGEPDAGGDLKSLPDASDSGARIDGYVDGLVGANVLRGWAMQHGNMQPLRIYALGPDGLIGEGSTGEARVAPAGNCGFTVSVSQPISLSDLLQSYVNVFAIGARGEQQLLQIWDQIAPADPDEAAAPGEPAQRDLAPSSDDLPILAPAGGDRYNSSQQARHRLYGFCEATMQQTGPEAVGGGDAIGCVDTLDPADVVRGWAIEPGSSERLRIHVLADTGLIGEGTAGEYRIAPSGNCGFAVKLARPISVADLLDGRVAVYAVKPNGGRQFLPIWEHLIGPQSTPAVAEPPRAGLKEIVAAQAFAAARPYVAGGEVLPPVCRADELCSVVEQRGLGGYVGHMTVGSVLEQLRNDHLPLPATANREGYNDGDDAGYWLFGFDDFCKVIEQIARRGLQIEKMLDFGASTGRVSRHFLAQAKAAQIYACDFNRSNVEWCKQNFPPEYRMSLNTFLPNLPFTDNFFDLITAFSVFTHIDEFEEAWILEFFRILRPGGIAYVTIHDENTWKNLNNPQVVPTLLRDMLKASPDARGIDFAAAMAFPRKAFSHSETSHYFRNVFHSSDYVRRYWGRYFDIESIQPFGHFIQAVVLMRKRQL